MGDSEGVVIVDKYVKYLVEGFVNVCNIFELEVICIGGGVSKEGEYLFGLVREFVYEKFYCK